MLNKSIVFLITIVLVIELITGASIRKGAPQDTICKLPKIKGYCRALILRWWYDASNGQCREFYYGGCEGNANNFESEEDCILMCAGH